MDAPDHGILLVYVLYFARQTNRFGKKIHVWMDDVAVSFTDNNIKMFVGNRGSVVEDVIFCDLIIIFE